MKRGHKYSAKKVIITEDGTMFELEQLKKFNLPIPEGIKFDSKMEAQYFLRLRLRQKAGEVKSFSVQPVYVLQESPRITYKPDFLIEYADGRTAVIDVKGAQTTAFRLKVRMFKAKFPDLPLVLAMRKGSIFVEVPA